jgi:rhodanese-related sulfurtransferase
MSDYTLVIAAVFGLAAAYLVWLKVLAPKMAGVQKLSIGEYREQFKKQPHLLLDVRSDSEYAAAHSPRAKHLSVEQVARSSRAELQELIKDKPVVCICASGSRSMMAATVIARYGFTPVYSLTGGMGAWQSAGMTVRRSNA